MYVCIVCVCVCVCACVCVRVRVRVCVCAYMYIHIYVLYTKIHNTYAPPSVVTTASLNSLLFLLKFFLLNSLLTVLLIAPVLSRSLCIVSILRGRSLPLAVVDGKLQINLKLSLTNVIVLY